MPTSSQRWTHVRHAFAAVLAIGGIAAVASAGLQDTAGFLWVAESGGVLNIATDSGAVRFEIPQTLGVSAVAVNDFNGEPWAYGNKRLLGFSRSGSPRVDVETPAPIHGGDPAELVVDGNAGTLWLAIKRDLYRYDLQGNLKQTLILPRNVVAATLDRDRSVLWVAQEQQLRLYDAEGVAEKTIDLPFTEKVADLAYDRRLGEVWVAEADRLRRYDAHGAPVFEVRGNYLGAIAPDGAGGLWQARQGVLMHYDGAGRTQVSVQPFAGQPDGAIVDVVADPHDASVWVASRKSVSQYAVDGERVAHLPELGDGVVRRLSRGALYADLDPPEMTITAPAEGSLTNNNRPTIGLSFFDLGVGVDPGTIRVSVDGQPVAASCTAAATTATCLPAATLGDGERRLAVTVADRMLNVSDAAEVRLTIDTVAPEISIASPAAGTVTNQAAQVLRGGLGEAGTLSLDGVTVVLDGAFRFAIERTLQEGANRFEFAATDRAGNTSSHVLAVMLDTVAPALPVPALIHVSEPSAGRVLVSGAAGSVEPGVTVRITNDRTGLTVTVVAAADGSFQATIDASAGDSLSITVVDAAANASTVLGVQVPAGVSLTIQEPSDGAALQQESVLVAGSFKGPLNSVITVNGQAAKVLSDGGVVKFHAVVALKSGANTVNVAAALQDGSTLNKAVSVTRSTGSLLLRVTPLVGTAPLTVSFNLTGVFSGSDDLRFDFNGDGVFDYYKSGLPSYGITAVRAYDTPGLYRPVAQLSRYNYSSRRYEVVYQQVVPVAVLDAAQLEAHQDLVLRSVWGGLNTALRAGDLQRALSALSFDSRTTYGETVFEPLLPQMNRILDDFTDIEPMVIADNYAEYAIMNVSGEGRVHVIGFVRGADGIWRIDQM